MSADTPKSGTSQAADTPPPEDQQAPERFIGLCYVLVIVGIGGAILLYEAIDPVIKLPAEGFVAFAPIYVVAQAIERFLEPLAARWMATTGEKDQVKVAREEKNQAQQEATVALVKAPGVAGTLATTDVGKAAEKEQLALAALRQKKAKRTVLFWAIATFIALLLSGALGLGILQIMAENNLRHGIEIIDVVLTGIAIGAGTKPLHDLIARLEKAKDNADPATKPTPPTPAPTPVTPPAA